MNDEERPRYSRYVRRFLHPWRDVMIGDQPQADGAPEAALGAVCQQLDSIVFAKSWDPEQRRGTYCAVNRAGARVLGLSQAAIVGRTDFDLLDHKSASTYARHDREVIDSGSAMTRHEVLHVDGLARSYLCQRVPLRDGLDAVVGVGGIAREVDASVDQLASTERERIAAELNATVINELFSAGLTLHTGRALSHDPAAIARIDEAIVGIDRIIKSVRAAVFDLHEHRSDGSGATARARMIATLTEVASATGVEPRVSFSGAIDLLPNDRADLAVRVLRSVLARLSRAQPRSLDVQIEASDTEVKVTVAGATCWSLDLEAETASWEDELARSSGTWAATTEGTATTIVARIPVP